MYLDNFEKMDPIMLMSIINMKLRNEFAGDLDELVKSYDLSFDTLVDKLNSAGFVYHPELGQFR